jgi:competence transcription factor ComK
MRKSRAVFLNPFPLTISLSNFSNAMLIFISSTFLSVKHFLSKITSFTFQIRMNLIHPMFQIAFQPTSSQRVINKIWLRWETFKNFYGPFLLYEKKKGRGEKNCFY